MSQRILYGTEKISELKPDCCYGLCNKKQRVRCEKEKECLIQLTGQAEDDIAGISPYSIKSDEDFKKRDKAVDKWRKKEFKECKGILFIIERVKEEKRWNLKKSKRKKLKRK